METYENSLHDEADYSDEKRITESASIPVMREEVMIKKSLVETGKIKVRKTVNEESQLVDITLIHEVIDVKTIPINQFVETMPEAIRYEGDTMIIPVLKEVSVVRIMLEKEIHITKRRIEITDTQNISLRKEEVTIENVHRSENQDQATHT